MCIRDRVRIFQYADLNNELIVEQAAVGIDREVGQMHQFGRRSPNRTVVGAQEQTFWQVWFNLEG